MLESSTRSCTDVAQAEEKLAHQKGSELRMHSQGTRAKTVSRPKANGATLMERGQEGSESCDSYIAVWQGAQHQVLSWSVRGHDAEAARTNAWVAWDYQRRGDQSPRPRDSIYDVGSPSWLRVGCAMWNSHLGCWNSPPQRTRASMTTRRTSRDALW